MIPLKTHNILDYVAALVLIASPYMFNFSDVGPARNLFLTMGFALAIYSSITQYQYSLAKIIPIRPHMVLDIVTGFVLMIGPYAFNYRAALSNGQTALHFVLGLGVWGLVALTRSRPLITEQGVTDVTDIRRDRAA
jgi:hypothetical protein